MSIEILHEVAQRRGVSIDRAFIPDYDRNKAVRDYQQDQQAHRQYVQQTPKSEYIKSLFRWYKEGTLRDGEHFFAQMPELFQLSGDLTSKQVTRLRRIQAKYFAAQPELISCPQNIRLEQYLETRRKITDEVKSMIFSMANSLTKTLDRKSAFQEAWRIAKSGGLKIPVAGITFGNRQEALVRLNRYDPKDIHTVLVPEPENPHDKDAIAVKVGVQNGKGLFTIGYIPRKDTKQVHALLKASKAKPQIKVICAEIASAQILLPF